MYLGKQPEGQFKVENIICRVVKKIIKPILKTSRNVKLENYLASVPLAKDLKFNHNITIIGPLRKNKEAIPFHLSNIKEKESVLILYVPQKTWKKNVLLLSTMHDGDVLDEEPGDQVKP